MYDTDCKTTYSFPIKDIKHSSTFLGYLSHIYLYQSGNTFVFEYTNHRLKLFQMIFVLH